MAEIHAKLGLAVPSSTTEGAARPLAKLEEELIRETQKLDPVGSLAHRIMMLVARKFYDQAVHQVGEFVEIRSKDFPTLFLGANRYLLRIETLIKAIEKNRSTPHLERQSTAKQQEIFDLVKAHFKELRSQLKAIEAVERALIVEDLRSTVWTVRALGYSFVAIVVTNFILDLSAGAYKTILNVGWGFIVEFCDWILSFFF